MSKYRHEYKYMINSKQEGILRIQAEALLQRDKNVNTDGGYYITSLYFDDYRNSCFYENENGTDPRSKFRIRYYNKDNTFLRLEKKIKSHGMTLKESCPITPVQCEMLMKGDIPQISDGMSEMAVKLLTEMQLRQMQPKVIVSYERIPFVYPAGNVRVTFDKNITSSNDIEAFLSGDFSERPIMEKGISILEVKWDELLPQHIKENLYIENLRWSAFSKYYLSRKFSLNGGLK